MHGETVRGTGPPGCPCTVDGHGELMTVSERDPVPAERLRQPAGERRRDWPIETKWLHLDARAEQLASEPSLSSSRNDDDVVATGRLELGGEAGQHTLGTAPASWFDEGREPRPAQPRGLRRR